ncbi:MAG TPA: hypothetical protein VLT62_08000 [Candidatus Methylomirabilis sp.]|nr:hypothetical protein [Candidatus Methylomirabilis sp.]
MLGGLRLLTDLTFDPGGSEYRTPGYVLRKTQGPGLAAAAGLAHRLRWPAPGQALDLSRT